MQFFTWLKELTSSQWLANARQYISFAAGIAATLGFISATGSTELVAGVGQVVAGMKEVVAGIAAIAAVLVPVINGLISGKKASPVSRIQDVKAMANDPLQPKSDLAKQALVEATESIPEVKGVLTHNTPAGVKLAESVPAPTVMPAGTIDAIKVAKEG